MWELPKKIICEYTLAHCLKDTKSSSKMLISPGEEPREKAAGKEK